MIRRVGVSALLVAALLVLAIAAIGVSSIAIGNALRDGEDTISAKELAQLPSMVLVGAEPQRARSSASGDLYIARANDAVARRIRSWSTLGEAGREGVYGIFGATWSPDGTRIGLTLSVWNSDPDGQVAVVQANGQGLKKLSDSSWTAGHGTWSPDAGALAYTYVGGVFVFAPRTGKKERIWQSRTHEGVIAVVEGLDWAPEGRRLAVAVEGRGILTMSRHGRNIHVVTHGPDVRPEWSPDGRHILFERLGGNEYSLWFVSPARGMPRLLTDGKAASWSPNGQSVLFAKTRTIVDEYNFEEYLDDIYVIGASGQNLRRLTSDGVSSPLGWSRDGSKIVFLREVHDNDKPDQTWTELWVMDADGGRQTRLPFNRPRWSVLGADLGR